MIMNLFFPLTASFIKIKALAILPDEWKNTSTGLYYPGYTTEINYHFYDKIAGIQFHQREN